LLVIDNKLFILRIFAIILLVLYFTLLDITLMKAW